MGNAAMGNVIWFLLPELCLFAGAVIVSVMGLSRSKSMRDAGPLVAALSLVLAFIFTPIIYSSDRLAETGMLMPVLGKYVKMIVCAVGVLLIMLSVGLIDRTVERAMETGRLRWDPLRLNRGEYFSFFLLSLIGVMLCCNANDLIWLFLALELTSLPTYIMVAMSRSSRRAQEAAVKYFFLGAMASATFLFGFAFLYGGAGTIVLTEMADVFALQAATGGISLFAIVGMSLAILGIAYKIAAAPMHMYAADVYEGAGAPVTAFLGFVPKAAGMIALILLLATFGWSGHADNPAGLPFPIVVLLSMMAILTMTLGNVGALLQTNVKRMLAYSSIAHSGYLLMGIIAGPGWGFTAVLFYLLAYGVTNTGSFAVLSGLERRGVEIETMDDIAGLRQKHPWMAVAFAASAGSLLGVPPLLGFIAKLFLFVAAIEAGLIKLVIIAGLNSAISAWYYLKLIGLPVLSAPTAASESVERTPTAWPRVAAILTAAGVIILPFFTGPIVKASEDAAQSREEVTADAPATDVEPRDLVRR